MIVVFSGTTEGRRLSSRLAAEGAAVTVCVATGYGAAEQGAAPGLTVHIGRMEAGEMAALLAGAALCVDATHPYARLIQLQIIRALRRVYVIFIIIVNIFIFNVFIISTYWLRTIIWIITL